MAFRHWTYVALFLTALPSIAAAQETLTIERAVQETLAHNPTLAAAEAGVRASAAAADAAKAAYFPRFSFGEAWQRGDQPVFVFSSLLSARKFAASNFAIDALNHPDPIGFFHATFGVEQLLFDGGRTRASVAAASLQHELASAGNSEASAGLAFAATSAYGQVLMAQAGRHAAEAAVAAATEDLARAQHRRDVGTATDADVLSLQVHLADMKQRAIQASGDEAIARAELNRLMGAPADRAYTVVEPPPASATSEPALSVLVAEAERARPELKRAEAAKRLAETNVGGARAAWMPQVGAQAGYELAGTRFNDRATSWIVGGELRWTLSAAGAEANQLRAAHEALKRAEAEQQAARAGVEVEVLTALRRLESARARRDVAAAAVEQARESQRIIRDRFEAGMLGVTEVLRAATMLLDADAQRTAATVDGIVSEAMLRRAIGRTP